MPEPEIIPPRSQSKEARLDDASLETLTRLLDDVFRIPGTNIRFGIDPLIGLIPGIGDLITSVASFLIIFAGWQRGLPRVTITRMVANVAMDTLVGSVPVLGDMFDAAWKNLQLLQRPATESSRRKNTFTDALFLGAIALVLLVLAACPFVVLWLLLHRR